MRDAAAHEQEDDALARAGKCGWPRRERVGGISPASSSSRMAGISIEPATAERRKARRCIFSILVALWLARRRSGFLA